MIQCKDCELSELNADGKISFACDPFSNVKEPECLVKWQLIKLDMLLQAYQMTLDQYRKLAPLQKRMMKHLERELDDIDEADQWKVDDDDDQPR